MAKRPTVYDVALAAGVSTATVSFAFSRPERVRRETLESVLAVADELGYVPSASARGLARGRTGAIGLYSFDYALDVDSEGAPPGRLFPLYVDEVQHGAELECRARGYALMLGGNRVEHLANIIDVAGRVDALISFSGRVPARTLAGVAARIPVVELGGADRPAGVDTVPVDNDGGMRTLTEHLLEVHRFSAFAYFGELVLPEFRARHDGFRRALGVAGVTEPEVITVRAGRDATAVDAVDRILASGVLPQVVVCDTDQSALATIDALAARGVRVPGDVAVTGFDGILAGRIVRPQLTTVSQPMEEIGRIAVRRLLDRLDGPADTAMATLAAPLQIGGTCGCR